MVSTTAMDIDMLPVLLPSTFYRVIMSCLLNLETTLKIIAFCVMCVIDSSFAMAFDLINFTIKSN